MFGLTFLTPIRVAGAVAAILAICALVWVATEPGRQRDRAKAAEAGQIMGGAAAASGAAAVTAVDQNAQADVKTNQTQRENSNAIDHAPDARTAVPGTAGALRRGLCEYEAYRHTANCMQSARSR